MGSPHYRRYELGDIEAKVVRAGFSVKYSTQYMAGIFPAVWLRHRLSSGSDRKAEIDSQRVYELTVRELAIIPVLNELFYWLLAPEVGLIKRGVRLLIGTSLLVVVHKGIPPYDTAVVPTEVLIILSSSLSPSSGGG